jgi:hypothetical protein
LGGSLTGQRAASLGVAFLASLSGGRSLYDGAIEQAVLPLGRLIAARFAKEAVLEAREAGQGYRSSTTGPGQAYADEP